MSVGVSRMEKKRENECGCEQDGERVFVRNR